MPEIGDTLTCPRLRNDDASIDASIDAMFAFNLTSHLSLSLLKTVPHAVFAHHWMVTGFAAEAVRAVGCWRWWQLRIARIDNYERLDCGVFCCQVDALLLALWCYLVDLRCTPLDIDRKRLRFTRAVLCRRLFSRMRVSSHDSSLHLIALEEVQCVWSARLLLLSHKPTWSRYKTICFVFCALERGVVVASSHRQLFGCHQFRSNRRHAASEKYSVDDCYKKAISVSVWV